MPFLYEAAYRFGITLTIADVISINSANFSPLYAVEIGAIDSG